MFDTCYHTGHQVPEGDYQTVAEIAKEEPDENGELNTSKNVIQVLGLHGIRIHGTPQAIRLAYYQEDEHEPGQTPQTQLADDFSIKVVGRERPTKILASCDWVTRNANAEERPFNGHFDSVHKTLVSG